MVSRVRRHGARHIVEVLVAGNEAAEAPARLLGLHPAEVVQGNILLPLEAPLDVPVRLAVADEVDRRPFGHAPSLSRDRSGASGFFMPTTW